MKTIIINIAIIASLISQIAIGQSNYTIVEKGTNPIEIPFIMHNGKPLLELVINGKKGTLMIDNGVLWDPIWLFGSPLVEELKLKPNDKSASLEGARKNNSTNLYASDSLTLQFENIIFYDQAVLISPPKAGFSKMFPGVDGQLCNTFFRNFIVEFDFIQLKVILHDPLTFKYNGNGSVLDMRLTETGSYAVPFSVNINDKVYVDSANIDLGGIYTFKVSLNTKNHINPPKDAKERKIFSGTEYFGKIKSMRIGDYTFKQPKVAFGDEKTARVHPKNLGLIGLPMFKKFRVTFDYFNNKIYLEPNKNFDGIKNC